VHCAIDLDAKSNVSMDSIDGGLDRALDRGEIIELYAHNPGKTVPLATIEHVLAGAQARGLAPVTYADFARGEARAPGLALSFDDTSVQAWVDALPLLSQYGARVTFFVSRYAALRDNERALVRVLADAGHDIEPHTVNHLNAPQYVETNGLKAYLNDEVWPSVDRLEEDGYEVNAFAYPFGARTGEIDDAIRARVPVLRSVEFSYSGVVSPCPN
jgi:peptidoglycan/xylan/chitin deacetylase (PgdA/CDA1 family)